MSFLYFQVTACTWRTSISTWSSNWTSTSSHSNPLLVPISLVHLDWRWTRLETFLSVTLATTPSRSTTRLEDWCRSSATLAVHPFSFPWTLQSWRQDTWRYFIKDVSKYFNFNIALYKLFLVLLLCFWPVMMTCFKYHSCKCKSISMYIIFWPVILF